MDKKTQPSFQVFAKRKNSADPYCNIYVRVTYERDIHEKSLGVKCLYEHWNAEAQTILSDPHKSEEVKTELEELKQKVMGSYYILLKMQKDFTMAEILGISHGTKMPSALSFYQCFSDVIARMEK
jgi:hypothetical protein